MTAENFIPNHEQLDQAITALLAGAALPTGDDPEVAELAQLAADLRYLPSPAFKSRLKSDLLDEAWLARVAAMERQPRSQNLFPGKEDPMSVRAEYFPTMLAAGVPVRRANFAASLALHGVAVALLLASTLWVAKNPQIKSNVISLVTASEISPYALPPSNKKSGGGGGGGDKDKIEASKGKLPKFANEQFTPPAAVIRNPNPVLPMEPSVVVPPQIHIAQNMPMLGDPASRNVNGPASNGTGSGGGIGSGTGGGVGSGYGPGVGPGTGGGMGGGIFRVGGGVTAPRAIYKPEAEYSEEGRKTKTQGVVVVQCVVGPDGRVRDMKIVRRLGMGLDQKALEALKQWKFEPAQKDGQPVPVLVNVEVNFRLY